MNTAAERVTGWARRDVVGRSLAAAVSTLYPVTPFDAERLIERVLAEGQPQTLPLGDKLNPDVLAPIDDPGGQRYGLALHFGPETLARGAVSARRALLSEPGRARGSCRSV